MKKSVLTVLTGLVLAATSAIMSAPAMADFWTNTNTGLDRNGDWYTNSHGTGDGAVTTSHESFFNYSVDMASGYFYITAYYNANGYIETDENVVNNHINFLCDTGMHTYNSVYLSSIGGIPLAEPAQLYMTGQAGFSRGSYTFDDWTWTWFEGNVNMRVGTYGGNLVPIDAGSQFWLNTPEPGERQGFGHSAYSTWRGTIPTPGAIATFTGGLIAISRRRRR